jgi:hypothetical protein
MRLIFSEFSEIKEDAALRHRELMTPEQRTQHLKAVAAYRAGMVRGLSREPWTSEGLLQEPICARN